MQLDLERTIVAVSSGIAAAQRAIVRVSGKQTASILSRLVVDSTSTLPAAPPRRLGSAQAPLLGSAQAPLLGSAQAPLLGSARQRLLAADQPTCERVACALDWESRAVNAYVYYWPNARSFTGEPSAEIHLLGALPIVAALVERITALGGVPAERGEFTLRSFLAGKIDLSQAEAVLGVIEAEASEQLEWALEQLAGNVSRPVRELRNRLVELLAHLEAGLDFVEEDIEFITQESLSKELTAICQDLEMLSSRLKARGVRSREPQVVLLGLPNAGKSSLFNALVGKERSIVTENAGTTRDAITEVVHFAGSRISLVDTAGFEELQPDSPRGMAQQVLRDRLSQASVAVLCLDMSQPLDDQWLQEQLATMRSSQLPVIVIGTKSDLASSPPAFATDMANAGLDLCVSCRSAGDLDRLRQRIHDLLASTHSDARSSAMQRTMIRCKTSIDQALNAIACGLQLIKDDAGEELVASELRCALDDLSCVIGEVHTEDILGEIFSRFCIGK